MKTLVLALALGVLLVAPLPAHGAGRGGGHGDGNGGSGHFGDHHGHGDFHHDFRNRRFGGVFVDPYGYPSCFAYEYCPYFPPGCTVDEGYWIDQPYIDMYGVTRSRWLWIPANC